jgi:hypothetical protein
VKGQREGGPADLEIGASWSGARARWSRRANVRTILEGGPDTEELSEREGLPEHPATGRTYRNPARRWRLAAWLRERSR